MRNIIRGNLYFFIPYLLFLMVCSILLLLMNKAELHLFLNQANSPFFDTFFRYATFLGDGAMIAIISLVLIFIRFRYAFAFLIGSLVTAGLINLFKKVILDDIYRPSKYFELFENVKLHLVEGVNLHSLQSFPSGHTGTAFNVFFILALVVKNNLLKLFFLLMAVIVAYSRVYISQHFLIDITVGSVIGIVIMFFSYLWIKIWKKKWLDNSLLAL